MMKAEPFNVRAVERNGEFTLYLEGELDLAAVPQLQGMLDNALKREDVALVLNLRNLTYIDSTGIGVIVSILKTRDQLDAPFYVQEIPAKVQRLFDLTGISGYLKEGAGA
ncbi:MAG: anti-sigma-factor antagonist [Paenibacillus sp.]|jgi:anti-sigma B factor antagonist|nr:anti-sigma-factor antagonist [Paenibacillus sp.]